MEEIKIKYAKETNIEDNITKIIKKIINDSNYKFEIIFINNEEEVIKNYKNLESYKLLIQNIGLLVKTIINEKKEIEKIKEDINEIFKKE